MSLTGFANKYKYRSDLAFLGLREIYYYLLGMASRVTIGKGSFIKREARGGCVALDILLILHIAILNALLICSFRWLYIVTRQASQDRLSPIVLPSESLSGSAYIYILFGAIGV